jgi:hypothetical protein
LDIRTDGTFSELELAYELAEVEEALPELAEKIRDMCHVDDGMFIELSLRREELLNPLPTLAEAWKLSGVVLEFQCPNGRDFEMDARGAVGISQIDDKH